MSDADLAAVRKVAEYDLPEYPPCDPAALEEELRMLTVLPRKQAGVVTGELLIAAYVHVLGKYPKPAIRFLRDHALNHCKFMPSPPECVEIISRWERRDAKSKRYARSLYDNEIQARYDDAMRALKWGEMEQAQIDALPERWKHHAADKGYVLPEKNEAGEIVRYLRRPVALGNPESLGQIKAALGDRFPSERDGGAA
ncbi:hypothetical protein [Erythrobacter sp. SG61-1L]|uniref:hypothetical protein n=1 Tax=Erythrobacter sp. SG61-1L TaxID=1603897 RepID=UPI0012E29EC6|nr:hypothetical protein [Erythrobacter sp. SG61-1L]